MNILLNFSKRVDWSSFAEVMLNIELEALKRGIYLFEGRMVKYFLF